MGNNNTHQPQPASVEVVKRPPSRPNAPPSSRPLSELGPRGPSYHSPQNQVLPKELPSCLKLRPVSMELSKYKPEYQNIFAHEDGGNFDENKNDNIENLNNSGNVNLFENQLESSLQTDKPPRPPPIANGHVPSETPISPVSQLPNGHLQTPAKPPVTSTKAAPYRPSHRRQMSLGQEHTILEEPEESIDSRVKLDPLMQSFPGATGPSLPVKNNFNLDYSYQLTYVQLAEHRRNKTIEELERRTGKKLSDLSADLNEYADKPAFDREAPSRVSTRSTTGSLGSALSSKKKKAPPPPGQAPPPPPGQVPPPPPTTPPTAQPYSIHNEPPVDYDLDSPRKSPEPVMLPRYTAVLPVSRVAPSVSKPMPAPPPPPGSSPRKPVVNLSRSSSMSNGTPEIILKRAPEIKTNVKTPDLGGQVPWLLEIKNLSEARAARRQQSLEVDEMFEAPPSQENTVTPDDTETENTVSVDKESEKPKLIFESSARPFEKTEDESEQAEKKTASVERSNSLKGVAKPPSPKLARHHSTTEADRSVPPQVMRQISEPGKKSSPADPVRRLNSLLQHDIKAAANAKCLKLVKQTTPVLPKPKDPHQIFREQLQKACAERDERIKTEGTIDEKLKLNTSNSNINDDDEDEKEVVKYNTTPRSEKKEKDVKEAPNTLPKPPRYHKNVSMNKGLGINRTPIGASADKSKRYARNQKVSSTSMDWTPEADLDSDDNLSDREVMTNRKGSSDGFKSTIIPNSITEMNAKKKIKSKKQKESGTVDEQAKKFGSVRKLRKSVNKSVRNAFGSISKASGKLLRKQRSEDFEAVDDAPKNWSLTADMDQKRSNAGKYSVPSAYDDHDTSDTDEDESYSPENEFSEVIFRQKSKHESEESSDSTYESEDKTPQNMRRAGVAYINNKGRLVLMNDDDDNDERIVKQKPKEKKDRKKAESHKHEKTDNLMELERKREEEKRKQLEKELEFHKLREAETLERLKRLEQLQQQQQLLLQQQHQQQPPPQPNIGLLGAPALPPPTSFQSYGTLPDPARAQTQTYANIFGQQLPQNGYQQNFGLFQTGNYMNGTVPGMTYDLNDYMRMLGQNPPTSQQMAYFLNTMTLNQPFDRKSNPALFDMFSQQYPNGTYSYSGMDGSMKKSSFQNWASSPNISMANSGDTNIPLSDFVASYNGAKNPKVEADDSAKSKNPLYNSDDSDGGLSPQKSVARAYARDYRKIPVRTESGKFMRKYASDNYVAEKESAEMTADVDTSKSFSNFSQYEGLPQQKRSASPSNSVSTVDSAMSSPSVTISTPSSPARSLAAPPSPATGSRSQNSTPGFRTILDLSVPDGASQILSNDSEAVKL